MEKIIYAAIFLLTLLTASYLLTTLATYVVIKLLGIALGTTITVNVWAAGGIAWIILVALGGLKSK